MNIFLSKAGRVPNAVGYFTGCEERGESVYEEYWECVFCLEGHCPYPYETTKVVWNEDGSVTEEKIMMNVDATWEQVFGFNPYLKKFEVYRD